LTGPNASAATNQTEVLARLLSQMLQHHFNHRQYLLKRQFLKLLGANLRIYDPQGNLVLFVHQKAFKLKEDIRAYAEEGKVNELLVIKARQIIDFSAGYDVFDAVSNTKVGTLKRKGWTSLVRDSWIIMDANDMEIGKVHEDKLVLALLRRFLTNLIPQSFWLEINGQRACEMRQHFNPFLYKMDIELTPNAAGSLDPRLALASAMLVALIEGRQG
jgi:uncharacterized protein YxjI